VRSGKSSTSWLISAPFFIKAAAIFGASASKARWRKVKSGGRQERRNIRPLMLWGGIAFDALLGVA
jgi:hypothetical protein